MALWQNKGLGWKTVDGARPDNRASAFLCCPGPSLASVGDLRGPGRTVYAMNTAYPHMKPDAWIGLDRTPCFDYAVWFENFPKITRMIPGDTDRLDHFNNVFYADLEKADPAEMFLRRANDAKFVWDNNTLIFATHFLIWSGHKIIHFVGCDMGGGKDYFDDRVLTAEQRANNQRLHAHLVKTLRRLTPLAGRNGIRFVSSTPGSPLNEFMPFLPLEEALVRSASVVPPRDGPLLHSIEADAAAGL